MKKTLICLCLILSASAVWASSEKAMNEMLKSWYGKSLETVVKNWGEADTIEGKKYTWKYEEIDSTPNTTLGNVYDPRNYSPDQTNRWYGSYKDGSFTRKRFCNRTLTFDDNNIVISGSYEGNSCPATSIGARRWTYKAN